MHGSLFDYEMEWAPSANLVFGCPFLIILSCVKYAGSLFLFFHGALGVGQDFVGH